ncbi:MAG: hypothetical protein ABIF82_01795 [Planctomycetota bacterium]
MKRVMFVVVGIVALMLANGIAGAGTIDWKGVTWDLDNGTAVVNPDGSLTLTITSGTGSGIAALHVNRLPWGAGTFDTVMDPWIQWSFDGHKGDIMVEQEAYPGPTVFAGSNWGYKLAGTRYTDTENVRQEAYSIWAEDTEPISHVVYMGKCTDGTVDFRLDSDPWVANDFLKTNVGGAWGFNDVYLRLRSGTATDTITFNDFEYGSGHVPIPEPAGLGLTGLALLAVRRRRAA